MNVHAAVPTAASLSPIVHRGDSKLIALCIRAKRVLDADLAAVMRYEELADLMATRRPPAPREPDYDRYEQSAAAMRTQFAAMKASGSYGPKSIARFHSRLETVVAYERECRRLDKEIGLSRAERATKAASVRSRAIIQEIADIVAVGLKGMGYKAALLSVWKKAGYELEGEGEALALSIATDARLIGLASL